MSKPTSNEESGLPFVPTQVAEQLLTLARGLGLSDGLTQADRRALRSRNRVVPDSLIEELANLADSNGGVVAGLAFDATAARNVLAHASLSRGVVAAGHQLATRVEDDSMQRRTLVADRAFAIYRALARLVRTPEGKSLRPTYESMQSLIRASRRVRRPRKEAVSGATETSVAAPKPVDPTAGS